MGPASSEEEILKPGCLREKPGLQLCRMSTVKNQKDLDSNPTSVTYLITWVKCLFSFLSVCRVGTHLTVLSGRLNEHLLCARHRAKGAVNESPHLICTTTLQSGYCPHFKRRKLRPREVKLLAQSHSAGNGQSLGYDQAARFQKQRQKTVRLSPKSVCSAQEQGVRLETQRPAEPRAAKEPGPSILALLLASPHPPPYSKQSPCLACLQGCWVSWPEYLRPLGICREKGQLVAH